MSMQLSTPGLRTSQVKILHSLSTMVPTLLGRLLGTLVPTILGRLLGTLVPQLGREGGGAVSILERKQDCNYNH